jgi:hypothetical protein
VFVEPFPEGEVSTTQLILTELLPSDHLTTDVVFWTYGGRWGQREEKERERENLSTPICVIFNLPRPTSSKQFSPEVVKVLRCKASLGVRVEEAVQSFRDTRPRDAVRYHKRLSILSMHAKYMYVSTHFIQYCIQNRTTLLRESSGAAGSVLRA